MALNKQEVIIEFNAETNEAERSVNSLTDSYSDLEKKIDDVASAQQRQASIAKNQGKQITDVTKAVDKVTDAEKKRARIETGAIDKRNSGSKTYGDSLTGVLGKVTSLTNGQTSFLQKGVDGFKQLKDGATGLTSGLGLVKGAVAATGIGLLITAGIELVGWVSDFMDAWDDNSAEKSLQAMVESQKEFVAQQDIALRKAQIQGGTQREILSKKQDLIRAQIEQAKREQDLASEQEDQEAILAAQNRQKQLAIDLTVLQAEKEQLLIDKLEKYRRETNEAYDEEQQRLEEIGEEEERLRRLRNLAPGRLLKIQEAFFRDSSEIYQEGFVKTFRELGITEITQENLDIFRNQYITGLKEFNKALEEEGRMGTITVKSAQASFDKIYGVLERGERFAGGLPGDERFKNVFVAQEAIDAEIAQLEELIELYYLAQEQEEETEETSSTSHNNNSRRLEQEQQQREQMLLRRQELEDELWKLTLEAQDQEEVAAMQAYEKRVAIAGDDEGLLKMAEEQLLNDLQQIRFKYEELRQQEMLEGEDEDLDPRIVMLEKYYAAAQTLLQQDLEYTRDEELTAIRERYADQLSLAEELGMDKSVLLEAQRKEELEINEHYDALEEQREQDKFQMRLQFAVQGVQAIAALGKAFASQDEADAERSFKVQKGLSIASATVSAIEAVINAYKTAQSSPFAIINPAYPYIQAGLAAAFGTAQVATIARQQYTPSGTPENIDPGPGAGGGQGLAAPTIDLSFLGEGAGQAEPIRAYVLAENVSNAQQANQKILDQATL